MKIRCDVCDKDEASVFCAADEAALCSACDHRVHHANKLAGKHQRFSLHHPSPKQAPLCDVCQEKRAFFFCQQDKAILCQECDFQIHKVNQHTKNHTRYLLTGVKLSSTAALYSDSQSSDSVQRIKSQDSSFKPVLVSQTNSTPPTLKCKTAQTAASLYYSNSKSSDSVQSMKPQDSRFKPVLVSQINSTPPTFKCKTSQSAAALYSDSQSSDSAQSIKPQDSKFKPVIVSQTNSTPPTLKCKTAQTAAALYSTSKSSDSVQSMKPQDSRFKPVLVSQINSTPPTSKGTTSQTTGAAAPVPCDNLMNNPIPTSSISEISEYLMEMLPGWHVEDFLDASPYGFSKSGGNIDVMPFWDVDLESNVNGFPHVGTGLWVPQVDAPPLNQTQNQLYELAFGAPNGTKEQFSNNSDYNAKGIRKWSEDSSFVVPQIAPFLSAYKRLRTSL